MNKEVGKSLKYDKKIELYGETKTMLVPQNVAGVLNTLFF
jgi:hypothetical protein